MRKRLYKENEVLEKPLDKGRSKEQNVGIKKSKPDYKKVKIQFYPPEENDALVIGFSRGRGHRPECYCLLRHVLTAPDFRARGIIICMFRLVGCDWSEDLGFGNTSGFFAVPLLSIKRLEV